MSVHPIFQSVIDAFIPPVANEGLRPVGEGIGGVAAQLDRIVANRQGKSIIQTIADAGMWDAPEHDSERYRMLDMALSLRGMPSLYGDALDCPSVTFNGWSFIRHCAAHATQRDCIEVGSQKARWSVADEVHARAALAQWGLTQIKLRHAQPGDVLLFKMPEERIGRGYGRAADVHAAGYHVGVLSAPGGELSWAMQPTTKPVQAKMVHCGPARPVGECWLGSHWTDNLVAAFSFGDQPTERPALKAVA